MKRILAALALALAAATSFGATTYPLSLLSPTGSTSGQFVVSTGATTAPVWSTVSLATLGGIVPVLNGGTGVTTAAAELSRIGALSTTVAASTYATIAQATTALAATGGSINGVTLGITTPAASKVTTLVATGLITPTSSVGIAGTATNDSPAAGSIGESPTPTNLTNVALTTATPANVASIPLAAGDWLVFGVVQFVPAGTTAVQSETAGISTTSATFGGFGSLYNTPIQYGAGGGAITPPPTPTVHIKLASAGTVYLVAQAFFTVSTCAASGFIVAIRPR